MAQRMLTIQPTEQRSLWTTVEGLVAPVLAMDTRLLKSSAEVWEEVEAWIASEWTAGRMDSPNSHEVCAEAIDFHVDAEIELATRSRSPFECMLPEKSRVLDTDLSKGIVEIVNEHVRNNPSKRLKFKFEFSTDQTHEYFREDTNTLIRIISCNNPEDNMKPLTKAIEDAFWTELDKVDITVDGNELEMRYDSMPLFKSEVKAAELYIKSAVRYGRYKWLKFAQGSLIDLCVSDESSSIRATCRLKLMDLFGLRWRGKQRAVERQYQPVLSNFPTPIDDALETKWGQKLIEEVIHVWFRGIRSTRGRSKHASLPFQWAFKCSGSSAEDIDTPEFELGIYASNLKDFICCLLRTYRKPPVIIRVTNSSDETLLPGPLSRNTRIKQSTGEAEEIRISIYDADGPELRRVLSCRSSDFYTGFCSFLAATDELTDSQIQKAMNGDGLASGNAVAPPSTTKSRKRKHGRQAPS